MRDAVRRARKTLASLSVDPVSPLGILVTSGSGADLRAMRERLGRSLAPPKAAPAPGPDGMLVPV